MTHWAVHQANEDSPPAGNDSGDAEHPVVGDGALVLASVRLEGCATGHFAEDHVGVDAVANEDLADDVVMSQVEAVVMAGGEERGMHGEEELGESVPHDQSHLHGEERHTGSWVVPDR